MPRKLPSILVGLIGRLVHLRFNLESTGREMEDQITVERLVAHASRVTSLRTLRFFDYTWNAHYLPQVDLYQLRYLPNLQSFMMASCLPPRSRPSSQLRQLAECPSLTDVDCCQLDENGTSVELEQFIDLRAGNADTAPIKHFAVRGHVSADELSQLARIPGLRSFRQSHLRASVTEKDLVAFIARLPLLEHIELNAQNNDCFLDPLCAAVVCKQMVETCFSTLSIVDLAHFNLSGATLQVLCVGLPLLRKLWLSDCIVDTLEVLASTHKPVDFQYNLSADMSANIAFPWALLATIRPGSVAKLWVILELEDDHPAKDEQEIRAFRDALGAKRFHLKQQHKHNTLVVVQD